MADEIKSGSIANNIRLAKKKYRSTKYANGITMYKNITKYQRQ